MTSVLITGGSGFIGRPLVRKLEGQGFSVIAPQSSCRRVENEDYWAELPPTDQVIHLAAKSVVLDSWQNALPHLRVNVMGTACALRYCQQHNARLIILSSFFYDTKNHAPFSETDPLAAQNPYGLSKLLAENLAVNFSQLWGIPLVCLRASNVFGPGQSNEYIISSIVEQICAGQSITIRDGTPRRDFLFIDDLIDVLLRLLNRPSVEGIYNVGSGISHSVENVINIAQKLAGTDLPVICSDQVRDNEIFDSQIDITKLSGAISWHPQWPLNKGLQILLDQCQGQ